jgi:hypothetical protein
MDKKILNYEEKYVAFLDILGFREMVNKNDTELINRYLNIVQHGIKSAKDTYFNGKKLKIESIIISDSILLSVDKNSDTEESLKNLLYLCMSVGIMQSLLLLNGIWLRGGISFGKAYFSQTDNQIIGPAYISAYDIENKIAKYPRVVLDSRIINELGFDNAEELIKKINNMSNHDILYPWNNKHIIKKDVPLFIDYIGFMLNYNEFDYDGKKFFLETLITEIKEKIYKENISVYVKFKWTIDYLISVLKMRGREDLVQVFGLKKL